jgi:hypothetical protein
MKGAGIDKVNELISAVSSNGRLLEARRQAEINSRDGNELEFLNASALKGYIKEQGLEGKLSKQTKEMLDKFDGKSKAGGTADTNDGRAIAYRVDARDLMDAIQLDTRHFVAKPLTTLTANDEEDPVASLSRFYIGNRVALVATGNDGVKAVIMPDSRGESKFRAGDFIGIDPASANQKPWGGQVQKVVTFTPQMAKELQDSKVEWLRDDYPITRGGKTVLDTTD